MAFSQSKAASNKSSSVGTAGVIGAAIAGVAVGLAANIGRKAVVQGMTAATGDWADGLKAEHTAALEIFDAIELTTDDETAKRTTLLTQLKHALGKHAFQEENVVYPAMREHGLTEAADHLNHDHGYVKQYLFDLTEMERGDFDWLPKVREFRTTLETHVREEEDTLFPKLHAELGDAGNKHVTAAMNNEGFKLA